MKRLVLDCEGRDCPEFLTYATILRPVVRKDAIFGTSGLGRKMKWSNGIHQATEVSLSPHHSSRNSGLWLFKHSSIQNHISYLPSPLSNRCKREETISSSQILPLLEDKPQITVPDSLLYFLYQSSLYQL